MRKKAILTKETIFNIVRDLKEQGKTIGLTYGAFDLFHFSHLDLLRKASEKCDYLIVGVECDENVSSYKTYKRPIIEEKARLGLISELNVVDAAMLMDISFDHELRQEFVKDCKADFVAIGQKFGAEEQVREDAFKAGASLIKFQTTQDYITTKIIEKIIKLDDEVA